jgi:hypothetical protein
MHAIAQVVWSARGLILTPGMGWPYLRRSSARYRVVVVKLGIRGLIARNAIGVSAGLIP